LNSDEAKRLMLAKFSLRIEPAMSEHVAVKMSGAKSSPAKFAVMGAEARSGVPMRIVVDPNSVFHPITRA
jgi:hypothetical protein